MWKRNGANYQVTFKHMLSKCKYDKQSRITITRNPSRAKKEKGKKNMTPNE